ncbi:MULTISPECIES: spermidine/putrescine ABC transporter substrate-binding protein [unclassified Salinicola]|uniref:polyamine ABC transporter substrate-binding protein n=1 Tax=unclassified Salinicola TaxID=2634022 RepID=UPI001A8D1380|nr:MULTISPECIES: spermidine/putrescine ABC transporter substrate-binding protein [unclassified Salinicola]MCE3025401.1 spermidine/putrescine ABC transporter substrate-binding protein [Salinicola sp. DM10]WIX34421.1 spermidine/putrescine ABC transporter substrate-binding protein [Salinicola sp. JS01]
MRTTAALCLSALCLSLSAAAQAQTPDKLYLFNWTEYADPGVIEDFEKQYGVEVVQSYFTSNAEMFSKLVAGGDAQFDVVVPTDYYVPRLVAAGLIQPLGDDIQGRDNLMPAFRHPSYDPQDAYSVPYLWGVTGIVYDTTVFPDPAHSWSLLLDPKVNPDQPFALLGGDPQVLFGMACAYQGHGFDCTQRDDWIAAAKLVSQTLHRPNFSGFADSTAAIDQIARGVTRAAVTYSGDLDYRKADAPETYGKLEFFIPEEGSQLGVDTLAIPKRAPHPKLAREFISFMLRPENAARSATYAYYRTPNQAALPLLSADLRQASQLSDAQRVKLTPAPQLEGDQLQLLQQLANEARNR